MNLKACKAIVYLVFFVRDSDCDIDKSPGEFLEKRGG